MTTHYPIAIIGAGLSGLTLARVLAEHGVEAAVFELEPGPEARAQGGMLDIHEDSGQAALRAAGLFEEFGALIMPGGEAMRVLDSRATIWMEEADNGGRGRPESNAASCATCCWPACPRAPCTGEPRSPAPGRWGRAATRWCWPMGPRSPPTCWSARTAPGPGSAPWSRPRCRRHRHQLRRG